MNDEPAAFGPLHAIVPLNVIKKSKARLSPLLRPAERARLTIAMLSDVLSALKRAQGVSSVILVSADKSARGIARRFRVSFVWEGERRGLNKGLRLAIRKSKRKGASAVLIIHADLPLLTPRELDMFLAKSRAYPVAITPSKDGTGTNALFLRPPEIIRPAFGKESFRRHRLLADRKKLRCKVLRLRGISFDLDEPRDLLQLMRRSISNETGRFLRVIRSKA